MAKSKNPAPRANAKSRVNPKSEQKQSSASQGDLEGPAAALWLAVVRPPMPGRLAGSLGRLASLEAGFR